MNSSTASLRIGGPHLGLTITYPSPEIVERIGGDWDWIWIDGQHGVLGYQDILSLVRACELIQRPAIVRVVSHEWSGIGPALDVAASGIVVPLVNSAAQARALVQAAKFPPLGERSYGGRRVSDRRGRLYVETANDETLLIAQIETPEGLKNAAEIAAVPGIDALFFGGDDMRLRLGCKMSELRPKTETEADVVAVVTACQKHGKMAVMVTNTPDLLALSVIHGYSLIVGGSDMGFLANSSKEASSRARNALKEASDLMKQQIPTKTLAANGT